MVYSFSGSPRQCYLEPNFRMECERHIPDTGEIEPAEAANAYLYLKANFDPNRVDFLP